MHSVCGTLHGTQAAHASLIASDLIRAPLTGRDGPGTWPRRYCSVLYALLSAMRGVAEALHDAYALELRHFFNTPQASGASAPCVYAFEWECMCATRAQLLNVPTIERHLPMPILLVAHGTHAHLSHHVSQ